jgi:diacylglycerol kinase (ATP)
MKLKLIFNPSAGRGRTRRHIEEVQARLRALGASVDVHSTSSADDLTRVAAQSSREAYDRVVVAGGDGTVHFALREFDTSRSVLGVVPLGSGDDFARVTGIPRDVEGACQAILGGATREIDFALANGIRYAGVAGLGFDSVVAAFANRVKLFRGSAVYVYAILRVLPRFRPLGVRLRIDGAERPETIMFATVGNSRQYGGGIRIVPAAEIDDGVLDFCIVHQASRLQLLMTLPLAYTGAHVKKPFVETGRGRQFHFESDVPLEVYADGERVTQTPVTFELGGRVRIAVANR